MTRKTNLLLLICLPLVGILAGVILMTRQVTVIVDGTSQEVTTRALTVRGALRSANVRLDPLDKVSPPASSWLSRTNLIIVERTRLVRIWNDSTNQLIEIDTPVKTPLEMLASAGFTPKVEDVVRLNGLPVNLNDELPLGGNITLQYTPAIEWVITLDGNNTSYLTAVSSIGQALWQQNIPIHGGDELNQPFTSPLNPQVSLIINSAKPLIITADGRDIATFATASTVGEALAMAGITLQDLDYSRPAEIDPLPEDGRIFVVRVREDILSEQQTIPYTTESTTDASLSMDQSKVITEGEYGLQVVRVHVRYEDGVEVSRETEDAVMIKQPVNEVVAYGTGVDIKTLDTPDGTITYWKSMVVTATSYSPCNSGGDKCYPNSAMGIPVQRGVIGVHLDWYRLLKGTKIYVPGYGIGTIADTGSYPNNHNWIDLGYSDAEYDSAPIKFASAITIYFLMPYPSSGPVVLP